MKWMKWMSLVNEPFPWLGGGECTNKSLRSVRYGLQFYEAKGPCAAVERRVRLITARVSAGRPSTTLYARKHSWRGVVEVLKILK